MVFPHFFTYLKKTFLFERQQTLAQWQEKSCLFVLATICLASLPALINSSISAAGDGLWSNLIAYNFAYLVCVFITISRSTPFKVRAWTVILVFLGLGLLSMITIGPLGSGRIWLFSSTIFATLVLGLGWGAMVLTGQVFILIGFYFLLKADFVLWANLEIYSPQIWVTTSITLIFLSVVSMFSVGRLIQGISDALEESKQTETLLQETASQLSKKVREHDQTIVWLKESKQRWHFALEGSGDGVWDWDLLSDQVFFSLQWKKMLGFAKEDISSDPGEWFNRIHPEDKDRVLNTLRKNIEDRVPQFKNRYRLVCRDGSFKWILDRGMVMAWSPDGEPIRLIGTHADITMIKELEDQHLEYESRLQQAQKMEAIGTLAGGIAHDFNNILFPILGHSEMLLQEIETSDKQSLNSLKQIHASALRAKELVHQILTFSRQETTEYRPVKVQFILKEVIKLLRSIIPKNIEIQEFIDPNCRPIFADAIQIHQIIMNLATNASHAMKNSGGKLKIYLKEHDIEAEDSTHLGIRHGPAVCLAMADTGTGMPQDIIDKIFDPFFTTKVKGEGTGMGLSVVHGIVKKMKGYINVYSEPGKGTEFKLYFPAEPLPGDNRRILPVPDTSVSMGNEHILLVDDELPILEMEKITLKRLGYTVTAENTPENALEIFTNAPDEFDLLITDLSMPGMSGNELTARLLKIRPDFPVILCTGFSEKMTPETLKELGIRDVIMKPVLLKDLSIAIRNVLDSPTKEELDKRTGRMIY